MSSIYLETVWIWRVVHIIYILSCQLHMPQNYKNPDRSPIQSPIWFWSLCIRKSAPFLPPSLWSIHEKEPAQLFYFLKCIQLQKVCFSPHFVPIQIFLLLQAFTRFVIRVAFPGFNDFLLFFLAIHLYERRVNRKYRA